MNTAEKTSKGQSLVGEVVSNRMEKTVIVRIDRRVKHPLYGKVMRRSTRIPAHDAKNHCELGDWVTIRECRPLSRTKSWEVVARHSKESPAASGEVTPDKDEVS